MTYIQIRIFTGITLYGKKLTKKKKLNGHRKTTYTQYHSPPFLDTDIDGENYPLQLTVGFRLTNFPLITAKALSDAVGYVCSESVKCDDCSPRTFKDDLALSLAVTLNPN